LSYSKVFRDCKTYSTLTKKIDGFYKIFDKKLQELIIKASGYRILVLKDNIPKVTKIIKDNGFFIEF